MFHYSPSMIFRFILSSSLIPPSGTLLAFFPHSTEFSSIPHDFYFHTNQNLVLIIKIFFVGLPISNKGFEIKITGHDFYITFMYFVIINLSFGFLSATMKIIIPNPQVFLMTSKEDIAFKIPNIFSRGHVSL